MIVAMHVDDSPQRRESAEVIRHYHAVRNEVRDVASGKRSLYTDVMDDIGPMIEARRAAVG
jgi:hypothetical protein